MEMTFFVIALVLLALFLAFMISRSGKPKKIKSKNNNTTTKKTTEKEQKAGSSANEEKSKWKKIRERATGVRWMPFIILFIIPLLVFFVPQWANSTPSTTTVRWSIIAVIALGAIIHLTQGEMGGSKIIGLGISSIVLLVLIHKSTTKDTAYTAIASIQAKAVVDTTICTLAPSVVTEIPVPEGKNLHWRTNHPPFEVSVENILQTKKGITKVIKLKIKNKTKKEKKIKYWLTDIE